MRARRSGAGLIYKITCSVTGKISAAHLGVPAPQKGRTGWKHSEEAKLKMSASSKGRPNKYKGQKLPYNSHAQTAETRARISETLRSYHLKRKDQVHAKSY